MPDATDPPLVTLAIPLYRSRRFLDVIVQNISQADYPYLEILVGDRHLADDTAERLRVRFAGDSRIRFITARDALSWVDHYNVLLGEARGEYFAWMPHDDSYPPGYVGSLVARLEAAPDSVLAFGHCDAEREDGTRTPWRPPPVPRGEWSAWNALQLVFGWQIGLAIHGVWRRARVLEAQLWLPRTTGNAHADTCWVFGVALLGKFEFVPETRWLKRFYPTSTYAQWAPPKLGELPRFMTGYLNTLVPSRRERWPALAVLWVGAAANRGSLLVNQLARRTLVSDAAMRAAFRWLLGGWRWR